ncbi:MAG TPA: segregation/condensation protein A [Anaerolineae bacterium]|nr:segregation/condensation protein A [Anaerolineae bacterium]HNS51448.1 segregation/condensation protein A [Anaerolineae bacterium]
MSQAPYEVALPVFAGPLDLLLRLIERDELDITEVSLAGIAQQFLDHVLQMKEANADHLAEFLVIAGKLLLIKSRALLPRPPTNTLPAEEDIGRELVDQLIEYRKFRQAADWLRELETMGLHSYLRVPGLPDVPQQPDLTGVTLDVLLAAVREALRVRPPVPLANGTIPPLIVTVAEQIERIQSELARVDSLSLSTFLKRAHSRLEIVVSLLAVLELVRRRLATVRQDEPFGEILVYSIPAAVV